MPGPCAAGNFPWPRWEDNHRRAGEERKTLNRGERADPLKTRYQGRTFPSPKQSKATK